MIEKLFIYRSRQDKNLKIIQGPNKCSDQANRLLTFNNRLHKSQMKDFDI